MKTTFVVGTEDEFITPEVLDKQSRILQNQVWRLIFY